MAKIRFESIYKDLKEKIENGNTYPFQALLPSENTLTKIYECSRNTVRRALNELIIRGYIQTQQGKRVRVIYQPIIQNNFMIGNIETFKETAIRNKFNAHTAVVQLSEIVVDDKLALKTGFALGAEIHNLHRVRYINGKPLILDINMFLKSEVACITKEIAAQSIYEYFENELGMTIMTSKRRMTVELATSYDYKYLDLGDYNCLAVISGRTYNSKGVHFEYTQSRHRPDYFCFDDTAIRKKRLQ